MKKKKRIFKLKARVVILEDNAHNHPYQKNKEYPVDSIKFEDVEMKWIWVKDGPFTFAVNPDKTKLTISKGNRKITI